MARRRARLNLFDKIILGIILVAVVFSVVGGIVGAIGSAIQESEDIAYTKVMAPALDALQPSQVTGNKAVAYVQAKKAEEDGTYTKTYIPEEWTTDDPAEVRYVVMVESGSSVVGTYSGNGGIALQRWSKVEIKDLKTGEIIDSNTFKGGNPPQSVKSGGNHYGSYPSSSKISEWVGQVLESR